jgi:hypothetical protein
MIINVCYYFYLKSKVYFKKWFSRMIADNKKIILFKVQTSG